MSTDGSQRVARRGRSVVIVILIVVVVIIVVVIVILIVVLIIVSKVLSSKKITSYTDSKYSGMPADQAMLKPLSIIRKNRCMHK